MSRLGGRTFMPSGVTLMLLASVSFSLMAACVKGASETIPVLQIVFWRAVLAVPILAWWTSRRGAPLVPNASGLLLARSLAGLGAMTMTFWSLGNLPIADVLLLGRMQPLLVALLAPWLLAERASRGVLWISVLSLAGVAMILRPSVAVGNLAGLVMLGAALSSGLAHIVIRRMSAYDHPTTIVFGFTAVTAMTTGLVSVPSLVLPSPPVAALLIGVAGFATAGQLLMTTAYSLEQAPVVAAASYSSVLLGAVWGYVFWSEIPDEWVYAGGAVVVAAGIALMWLRWNREEGAYTPGRSTPVA